MHERQISSPPLLTAGGVFSPSGATLRTLCASLIATVLIALPLAAVFTALRTVPVDLPAALDRVFDGRTEGEKAIAYAQGRLDQGPAEPKALAGLAAAYLLRVRETADPSYYAKADALLAQAAAKNTNDPDVVIVQGSLALSRHDFGGALALGERAVVLVGARPAAWGVLTDALVELGRYDEAVVAAQRMVDLRPDLASYSRVSYLRELHGDIAGAIDAMRRAVAAGAPTSEATAWSEVQLGHLSFAQGDLASATAAYENAQRRIPNYIHATAGLARVRAAHGDLAGAARLFTDAAGRLPLPEYVVALGDTYARLGDQARAEQQYALVAAMHRIFAANGVRVDLDLALYDADHGVDLPAALAAGRVEYALRQSVHVADTLAWAEYRSGDLASAQVHSREALRLGSSDPLMLYRAGVIALAAGETERGVQLLERSFTLNPRFSILYAPDLAQRLGR